MNHLSVRDYITEYTKKQLPTIVPRELEVTRTKRRIITIIGPRRAGKTYYFYQLINENRSKSLYLNFEDTRLIELKFNEIREVIRMYIEITGTEPEFLFFDEIQNIKNWEFGVRELLDLNKYSIFITGSSSKLLSKEIATSLRGRTITYTLLPFSFSEYLNSKNIKIDILKITKDEEAKIKNLLIEYLEFGGFPEVVLENEKLKILKEYYDLILFKDIVERHNIKNISLARFLLSYFAQNFTREISIRKIIQFFQSQGKTFGKNTLYDYIDKIQDSIAIFMVSKFSKKIYERESWPKKIYICDNGISKIVRFDQNIGSLIENLVFLELLRMKNKNPILEIFYYKGKDFEIDFVLKEGAEIKQLIQVCYNIEDLETKQREVKALIKASNILSTNELFIINFDYDGEEVINNKIIKFKILWKWLFLK